MIHTILSFSRGQLFIGTNLLVPIKDHDEFCSKFKFTTVNKDENFKYLLTRLFCYENCYVININLNFVLF